MYNVYLTIGHNVNGIETLDTKTVCEVVTDILGIEAFTAIPCFGMWRKETENSTRIEINMITYEKASSIRQKIPTLCAVLSQQEIMYEQTESKTQFIESALLTIERTA